MIGIRFEIPNNWNNYLEMIFRNIDIEEFVWKISDEEIFLADYSDLFDDLVYDNFTFKKIIFSNKYYLISGNIAAYKMGNCKNIYCYEDFKNSSCEILMIIVDSCYIDIYVKNSNILKQLKNNAVSNRFKNIQYIYNDNSKRNIFHT